MNIREQSCPVLVGVVASAVDHGDVRRRRRNNRVGVMGNQSGASWDEVSIMPPDIGWRMRCEPFCLNVPAIAVHAWLGAQVGLLELDFGVELPERISSVGKLDGGVTPL